MRRNGFTLIELLVVIGIIAILAAVVIIAINPGRQFAQARDTQRWGNINALLNAIGQRMADNRGVFETNCTAGSLPTTTKAIGSGAGNYDIEPCIIPTYISTMPMDPVNGTSSDTGYSILYSTSTRRTTITAPGGEIDTNIAVTR